MSKSKTTKILKNIGTRKKINYFEVCKTQHMKKLVFLFVVSLFNFTSSYAQNYTEEDLCNLIKNTYNKFQQAQVYKDTYLLSLKKEEEINYTYLDWTLKKQKQSSKEEVLEINKKLEEQRRELPSKSQEISTYEYRVYKQRKQLLNNTFEIVEGYNPSIEGAKLIQTILPNVPYKFYLFGIRFTKDINLDEGLVEKKGSMNDFQNLKPYVDITLISSINIPNYLKRTNRYTYAVDSTWKENGEEYFKISFQPNHKKESYSGFLVINKNQKVFTEVYAETLAMCNCNSFEKDAKNLYHVIYKENENGQYLPEEVTVTKHYVCSYKFNGWSKFVSVKDESSPKVKFKLKGKEEYAKKITSYYTASY